MSDVKTWVHDRKGRIIGTVVRQDDTWMWVRLVGDHRLMYGSESYRGRVDEDGDVLCVRASWMHEITNQAPVGGSEP